MRAQIKFFGLGLVAGACGMFLVHQAPRSRGVPPEQNPVPLPGSSAPTTLTRPFDWRSVESDDYPTYIANLRLIGCPEETIRDLITADVNKLFEERRRTLSVKQKRYEYWKGPVVISSAQEVAERQLENEKRVVLKELLGVESVLQSPITPPKLFEEALDFLSPSKRDALQAIQQRHIARSMELMNAGADMSTIRDLQPIMDSEVAGLFSPKELHEYQLRMSQTAFILRADLTSFEPSEHEFRAIFKLRKDLEEEFGTRDGRLGSAATAKMDEELKILLGQSRYAEFERSQDYAYQSAFQVAIRHSLDKDAAERVFNLKQDAERQAKTVQQDASMSREQRAAALLNIRREAETAVRSVFNPEAFQSWQRESGFWLRNISPNQ
jgi:hypothetical protein